MANNRTTAKHPGWWMFFVIAILGFTVNVIEGPKTVVDWIAMTAMLGTAIIFGLLLSGRMKPK